MATDGSSRVSPENYTSLSTEWYSPPIQVKLLAASSFCWSLTKIIIKMCNISYLSSSRLWKIFLCLSTCNTWTEFQLLKNQSCATRRSLIATTNNSSKLFEISQIQHTPQTLVEKSFLLPISHHIQFPRLKSVKVNYPITIKNEQY